MFSGIVETTGVVRAAEPAGELLRLRVELPPSFTDLKSGDSVCMDGVCLTVEDFTANDMGFALGLETLKVTGWSSERVLGRVVNLERSLRLHDRIHGHLVTGHVDQAGKVVHIEAQKEWRTLSIEFTEALAPFIWTKGSITINGVSLTINSMGNQSFQVGLIPETLKRTNMGRLQVGDPVNLEVDNMARGLVHWAQLQREQN